MVTRPLEESLGLLAAPIRRDMSADAVDVVVHLAAPCREVRLLVHQFPPGADAPLEVARGAEAPRPLPDGTSVAHVRVDLPSGSGDDLATVVEFDHASPPPSTAQLGDLFLLEPARTILDVARPPEPPQSGQLRVLLGPVDLGHLEFGLDCDDCPDQVAAACRTALGSLPRGPSRSALLVLLRQILPGVSRRASLGTLTGRLTGRDLASLVDRLMPQPMEAPPPPAHIEILNLLNGAAWGGYDGGLSLAGHVAPRVLGMRLGPIVRAFGRIGLWSIEAGFRFHASRLLAPLMPQGALVPGLDQAILRTALPTPGSPGAGTPPSPVAGLDERVTWAAEHMNLLLDFVIAPFGLELSRASGRVCLPSFSDHPALHPGWKPLEERTRRGSASPPSRADVLLATLGSPGENADLLGSGGWSGDVAEIRRRLPSGTPGIGDLDLGDVFPHGGFLGAGVVRFPKLLSRSPFEVLATLAAGRTAPAARSPFRSPRALAVWVTTTLSGTEPAGSAAFYLPPPTPSSLDSPLETLRSIQAGSADPADAAADPDWPMELGFFSGRLGPSTATGRAKPRLLGIPIASGTLRANPGGNILDLLVSPDVSGWVGKLLGASAPELGFKVLPGFPVPIGNLVEMVSDAWSAAAAGGTGDLLDDLADRWAGERAADLGGDSRAEPDPAERTAMAAEIRESIRPLDAELARLSTAIGALPARASAGRSAAVLAPALERLVRLGMPGVSLRRRVSLPRGLPGLGRLLETAGRITLHARSMGEADGGTPAGVEEDLRTNGGIALEIQTLKGTLMGRRFKGASAWLGVRPPRGLASLPTLRGRVPLPVIPLPGLTVTRSELFVDTGSEEKAWIEVEIEPIHLGVTRTGNSGAFRIEPLRGDRLRGRIALGTAELTLDPARLVVDLELIQIEGRAHGATRNDPLRVSLDGDWADVRVSLDRLELRNPLDPTNVIRSLRSRLPAAKLAGNGMKRLDLSIPELVAKALWPIPGGPKFTPDGAAALSIGSNGALLYRLPVTAGRSGLFGLSGSLDLGAGPDAPFGRIPDAEIDLPFLEGAGASVSMVSEVMLDAAGFDARGALGNLRCGVPDLLELKAGSWDLRFDVSPVAVTLDAVSSSEAWVLGKKITSFFTGGRPGIKKTMIGPPKFTMGSNSWVNPTGLGNLLRFRPTASLAGSQLDLSGTLNLLKRATGSTWKISTSYDWSFGAGDFEKALSLPSNALSNLLGDTGVVRLGTSSGLRFGRDDDGFYLKLRRPKLRVLWKTFSSLSAKIASNGRVSFAIPDVTFADGSLSLVPDGDVRVRANLRDSSLGSGFWFPKGSISSTIPGFPSSFGFPRVPSSGWTGSVRPTRSSSDDRSGVWRSVPLIGTRYASKSPEIKVKLESGDKKLVAKLSTGGFKFKQPDNFGGWVSMSFSIGNRTYTISSNGSLDRKVSFGSLSGAGKDEPKLADLVD